MAKSDPEQHPEEAPPRRQGRLRSAYRVLRGDALVHAQIFAEWAEYQLMFGDLLTRFSALLARQAKSEKKRVSKQVAEPDARPVAKSAAAPTPKAELRRRAAQLRGVPAMPNRVLEHANGQPPPPDEDEP